MSNIKDQIITLVKQRHHSHKVALEQEKVPRSKHAIDLIARIREDSRLIEVIDSLPEEKPSEDLEEAASRGGFDYVDEIEAKAPGLPWNDHDVEFGYRDGFIAGAEWQKEQMMKEAVDYKICNNLAAYPVIYYEVNHLGLKYGDKVKLIIVKEDDRQGTSTHYDAEQ